MTTTTLRQGFYLCIALLLTACTNPIKNEATVTVEEGATITEPADAPTAANTEAETAPNLDDQLLAGTWVGDFKNATNDASKGIDMQGFYWDRTNKITIELQTIKNGQVQGRSIVAGNDRPFSGTMERKEDGTASFEVKEPGDDRYDGAFSFTIKDDMLKGTWTAYKDLDVKNRNYELERRQFTYNADQNLEYANQYVDWTKTIEKKEREVYNDGTVEEWISQEFATATDKIYEINASNTRLTQEQVANLKRGDLTIIRNAIYARHGYSFKSRPLRVFFDEQPWYMPVHTDIRSDFTELEKENITLLLRYEKNAAEYYDRFGR